MVFSIVTFTWVVRRGSLGIIYCMGRVGISEIEMEGTCMGCWADSTELTNDGFGNYVCLKCRGLEG